LISKINFNGKFLLVKQQIILYTIVVVELPTVSEDTMYKDCRGEKGEGCVIRTDFPEFCNGRSPNKILRILRIAPDRPRDCFLLLKPLTRNRG
jgi:hypothetical protein